MRRTFWRTNTPLSNDSATAHELPEVQYEVTTEDDATLIGSSTDTANVDGVLHMPAIDIDLPCELIESSTPGHFHLYIDKAMTWQKYKKLLVALTEAGVVERGYCDASIRHGQSFLRKPGLKK